MHKLKYDIDVYNNKEYIYYNIVIFVIFFEILEKFVININTTIYVENEKNEHLKFLEIISTTYKQNYIKNGKREC